MAVYKDNATGTWRVIYRFTNWKGERKQTQKRGFATKREAQAWEHEAMLKQGAKLDMTFASFFEVYEADKKQRVKESTWESKSHVIRTKILPYFGNRKIAEIEAKDIIAFAAYLHMDEATPHLHIDFVPYTTGSKRGLDTRVSLKQALSALGFKGGTRRETELNQWVAYEKEQLAVVMLEHGIEWEKKGTHEKHLSVLDFEKKERAKEVAELEAKKAKLQEENAAFQEINEDLHEQLLQVDDEIRSLQEDLQESRQEAEKAQKQADKYQKRMNELAPMVKNMEKLAADFSADPEQTLPEAAVVESAKSYREKKAKPLVVKMVQVMRSIYSAYLDISNKFTKLQAAYNRERSGNDRLTNRLEEVLDENRELRIVVADFGRIKAVVGSEKVNAVINRAKQQEQIEAEQKRAIRRKYNREAR